MTDSSDNEVPRGDAFSLADESQGTWLVATEEGNCYYLDLDNHFTKRIIFDDRPAEMRSPSDPPRLYSDEENVAVPHISVCQVGQPLVAEIVVGEPPRPRTAINSRVVAILRARS